MSDVVVNFTGITRHDLSVEEAINFAKKDLSDEGAVIIGYDKDGELYFTSTYSDGAETLWLLEKAKMLGMDCNRYRCFNLGTHIIEDI